MKNYTVLLFGLLCSGCVMAEPRLKASFHVTDAETGGTLTNASVMVYNDGWETKQVDKNGFCTFETQGMSFGWKGTAKLEGYYNSKPRAEYKSINHALNRWEPWNPTIEVRMRKKKNPVAMATQKIDRQMIPVWEQSVGFDLEKGDWVAPYGKGVTSDFIFTVKKAPGISGALCEITFSNAMDGIQEYVPTKAMDSEYIFPYLAPLNNYASSLYREKVYTDKNGLNFRSNAKPDTEINHIFRVRTVVNEQGNIVKACYGRIQGELRISSKGRLYFKYWFNPVPNERSLEWNGENLLKKN